MSILAKLSVDHLEVNALKFHFSYSKLADANNRPTTKTVFNGLTIVIEVIKALNLEDWAIARNQTKQLELHILPRVLGGKTRKIILYDCHLLGLKFNFSAKGTDPMSATLNISSGGVKDSNSGAEYSAYWKTTYDTPEVEATKITESPEPTINKISWIHPETKETLEETTYTESIALTAQIDNQESSSATITITKEDGTAFENEQTELSFEEAINEDGAIELTALEIKEQWQEFKTADIDKLVAKVEHNGVSKKSTALQIVPPPKVIVDFRPSKGYDGEYGFDFMRNKKTKDDKLNYKDILGTNNSIKGVNKFTKYKTDTKYNDLKDNQYKKITFPWYKDTKGKAIEYIQSWLTIYPKETQTLSLQIDTIENPKKLELTFEYDKTLFKLNTNKIPAQSKGKKRLGDYLTIECLKAFSTDQIIKVMYQKRQLGQLNILKNDKANRKKAQVVFIKVKTELYSGSKLDGNTTNKTGKPEKEMLTRYLKQAYTKLELDEITFDLTKIDKATKKPKYLNFNKNYTLLDVVSNPITPPKILNKYHNTGGDSLAEFMGKTLNKELPKYKDHFKVFFFGDSGGRTDKITKIKKLAGYAKALNSQSAIMFVDKRKATTTHELLHCMGLLHSFDNNANYGYKKKVTQNIKDYSSTRKYIWLWQWKQHWTNKALKKE